MYENDVCNRMLVVEFILNIIWYYCVFGFFDLCMVINVGYINLFEFYVLDFLKYS